MGVFSPRKFSDLKAPIYAIFSTCHEMCLRKIDLEYQNGKQLQFPIIKITESKENKSIQRLDVSGSTGPGGWCWTRTNTGFLSHSDRILASSIYLGWSFATWNVFSLRKIWPISVKRWQPVWSRAWPVTAKDSCDYTVEWECDVCFLGVLVLFCLRNRSPKNAHFPKKDSWVA